MAGFFVTGSKVEVYGAALNAMAASPTGPVGTVMQNQAVKVTALAIALCPVETPESARRHHREAGRLKASIHYRRAVRYELAPNGGVAYEIGSGLVYARRIEFNHKVGGFLRGALGAYGGTLVPGGIKR